MVFDTRDQQPSPWATAESIAGKFGCTAETLRETTAILIVGRRAIRPGGTRPPPPEVNAFSDEHRDVRGVGPICNALQVAPSAHRRHAVCQRKTAPLSARTLRNGLLLPKERLVDDQSLPVGGADKVSRQFGREGTTVARAAARACAGRCPTPRRRARRIG